MVYEFLRDSTNVCINVPGHVIHTFVVSFVPSFEKCSCPVWAIYSGYAACRFVTRMFLASRKFFSVLLFPSISRRCYKNEPTDDYWNDSEHAPPVIPSVNQLRLVFFYKNCWMAPRALYSCPHQLPSTDWSSCGYLTGTALFRALWALVKASNSSASHRTNLHTVPSTICQTIKKLIYSGTLTQKKQLTGREISHVVRNTHISTFTTSCSGYLYNL